MKNIMIDYGALGDGITNDTLAFQAAANSGYPVLIPYTAEGYVVSDTCSLASNTYFIGEIGTKILHEGTKPFVSTTNSNTGVQSLVVDGTNTSSSFAVIFCLDNTNSPINNIYIKDITLIHSYGLIYSVNGDNPIGNLQIDGITCRSPKGITINLSAPMAANTIQNVLIDYADSTLPDIKAIYIARTNGITNGVLLNNIKINGTDSSTCPNQDGIVIGRGEHATLHNIDIIYMGGIGISMINSINFRMSNVNVSFCAGNQIVLNTCSDSTISNIMCRGRANGSLSFLVTSTYGLVITNSSRILVTGSNFKSNGAGIWHNASTLIQYTGCECTINTYHGLISTNTVSSSNISGCLFTTNGVSNITHSSPIQYANDCLVNFQLKSLVGGGSI